MKDTIDKIFLVEDWKAPEHAYDHGSRAWLRCSRRFLDEMNECLPPTEVSRTPSHGYSFAVSEAWKHVMQNGLAQPVYLFFRTIPEPACRMATALEMHREIFGGGETNNQKG